MSRWFYETTKIEERKPIFLHLSKLLFFKYPLFPSVQNDFTSEALRKYRRHGRGAPSRGGPRPAQPGCDAASRLSTSAARADSACRLAFPPAPAPGGYLSAAARIRKRIRCKLPTPPSARTWPGSEGSRWAESGCPSPRAHLLPVGDSLGGEVVRWREAAGGGSASGRAAAPARAGVCSRTASAAAAAARATQAGALPRARSRCSQPRSCLGAVSEGGAASPADVG